MGLRANQRLLKTAPVQQRLSLEAPSLPLSSRPERTRISYFALLATNTCAALCKESRMQIIKATALHRKSGGAQWRDLRFSGPSWKCFRPQSQWATRCLEVEGLVESHYSQSRRACPELVERGRNNL
jgi:hypothetical protein